MSLSRPLPLPSLPSDPVDAVLARGQSRFVYVLVPGLNDSGPEHWQSHWHAAHPSWLRMTQRQWSTPDLEGWLGAIRRRLAGQSKPAILIGHSMGALAACTMACRQPSAVAAVMLVAPAEPARFELEEQVPDGRLPCPGVLVASHNDPLLRFSRAEYWAEAWGCRLADIGEAGHVNVESGHGPWPHGLRLLSELVDGL
ncbi:MAG: alpha/beta hydrolase [Paludibacterium sp.]|uniref:RBBP9/YdeN family alpha/beta hydrolase n=1 Tax=Paludibacterium sp. TaxID=1917523 RepID=UPI0025FB06C2|nr:alpha/beta hydrolase [Paludibacterium sp.]MBV8045697.1 alpha/beta hydrolase [Paludibacterium sp.]MBV8649465.1 alpha/beta hydrolase [Paludibacterium sp.]